jgi:hypothetical protein
MLPWLLLSRLSGSLLAAGMIRSRVAAAVRSLLEATVCKLLCNYLALAKCIFFMCSLPRTRSEGGETNLHKLGSTPQLVQCSADAAALEAQRRGAASLRKRRLR